MFLISKKKKKERKRKRKTTTKTRQEKGKETKEEKRISVENLTGCDDLIWKSALCIFNLHDRVANFSWLFM